MVKDLGPVVKQAVVNDVVAVLAILTSCLIGQKMRKQALDRGDRYHWPDWLGLCAAEHEWPLWHRS